mmetsp:Transcript_46723/g.105607  ORF Transcript_46723/g.105607 Transcript_46723/m.105607 type:complete len:304 (+) Transcript_46723:147-1058(+)
MHKITWDQNTTRPGIGRFLAEHSTVKSKKIGHMKSHKHVNGCSPTPGGVCDRFLIDDFVDAKEVATLLQIAEKGMSKGSKSVLGPTIMDVNSGWVLNAGAYQPRSIYAKGPVFSEEEYSTYRHVTERLKQSIETHFGLTALFFTAPTFITREASDAEGSWKPKTLHDEYWHPHVDKNNTEHYDYSGLVYLSTSGFDFEGGSLQFFDDPSQLDCSAMDPLAVEPPVEPGPCEVVGRPSLEIEPRAGRAVVFGSGPENPHRVTRVTKGTRFVLSFWFTCDARREMKSFLDGKMHVRFGENIDHEL